MYVINSNYFFCCSDIINLSRVVPLVISGYLAPASDREYCGNSMLCKSGRTLTLYFDH